jgi:hypothetical protein
MERNGLYTQALKMKSFERKNKLYRTPTLGYHLWLVVKYYPCKTSKDKFITSTLIRVKKKILVCKLACSVITAMRPILFSLPKVIKVKMLYTYGV